MGFSVVSQVESWRFKTKSGSSAEDSEGTTTALMYSKLYAVSLQMIPPSEE
jgi:hypothetical protein